jgi:pimeloyl-ACP methyl ester carboxylesterase
VRWRIVAVAAAVATLAAACTPTARWVTVGPSAGASTVDWQDCAKEARAIGGATLPRNLTFDCGTVSVPRDWATAKDGKPADGRGYEIAVMRIRSNRQGDRIGSILVNPGGPGSSGIDFAVGTASRYTTLLARFDLVAFDPRGVGRSAAVECLSDTDLDASFGYEPDPTGAAFDGLVTLTRRMVEGCATKYGEDLRLFGTEQAARDMDAIRAALGEPKLTYLGYSYGTLLGAVYAELFPTKIRALVLDGADNPQQTPVEKAEGQAKGFELAFSHFATWCAANASRCPIAPDARAATLDALAHARTAPVRGSDGRPATAGWVFTGVAAALYSEEAWGLLARGLANLAQGDSDLILGLADAYAERDQDGHYTNIFDAYNAISCTDSDGWPTVERIRQLQGQWRPKYPLFGAALAVSLLSCSLWTGKHDPVPVGPATGAPPIVVVGTTGDPATPYEATAKLASMLGTGVVLTWGGEGHTAYPGPSCINDAVNRYLIELVPPPSGKTCPA